MNHGKQFLLAVVAVFIVGITPLSAVEADPQSMDYVKALVNNQFLLENIRLIKLAESCFAEGKYDDAVNYAVEAMKYAEMSDDYVAQQKNIKEVNDAIAAAQARLAWAKDVDAPKRYADLYGKAEAALAEALDARSREDWDTAHAAALRVVSILEGIPGGAVLPAQYLVKNWHLTKDCLWNIAKKPEIYGNPWQWRHIYNANKDKLPQPNNPDLIHPDMILDIPSIKGEVRKGLMVDK